ncbi:hypothetical protein LSAT2_007538 [Lamellibrachia satsuma]|nr:hypothetical protein LSAT2_007538 [Lamellibrachia satsuma]
MPTDRGIKQSTTKAYGTRKRTRLAQMKYAREQRQKSTNIAGDIAVASGSGTASSGSVVVVEGGVAEPGEIDVRAGADDDDSVNEPSIASSSQTDEPDVADDGEPRQPVTDDSCLFVQVSSLKKLVENLPCPVCHEDLTVVVIDKSKGPVVGFRTECTTCGYVCSETLSSGRIGNRGSRSPFATTRRMVAGTMDCGIGLSGLRRICWWLDSPCIHQKTYARHQKQGTEKTVAETTAALGFQLGEAQVKLTRSKDRERTAMLQRKADAQEKKNRERRRLHRIRQQDMLTQAEGGPSYASGEF